MIRYIINKHPTSRIVDVSQVLLYLPNRMVEAVRDKSVLNNAAYVEYLAK